MRNLNLMIAIVKLIDWNVNICFVKRFLYSLLIFSICVPIAAQEHDSIYISQYVYDSFTKHGIPEAFVTLTDSDGVLIDTIWTEDGRRSSNAKLWIKKVCRKPNVFLVKIEHPDYETVISRLEMKKPARQYMFEFPDIEMKRKIKTTEMSEVTITATRIQLTYKGDTIVVDAQAFKIPEGSMLDALVASVPGAELHDDGTIYMNGRKVDYLTLNGKDFFKGKNRIALDNLPYYVVSKLKFYEKDMPRNQMIHRDTGKKDYVMDVEMKREYSIGYIANVEAGIGTGDKWLTRLFGLRFTDNSRMFLFAGANNVNEIRPPGSEGWHAQSKVLTGERKKKMVGGSFYVDDKNGKFKENVEVIVNWENDKEETRTAKELFLIEGQAYSRAQNITRSRDFNSSLSNNCELKKKGLFIDTNAKYYKRDGLGASRSASFSSDPSSFGSCIQVLDSIFSSPINTVLESYSINRVYDNTKYNSFGYSLNQDFKWERNLPCGDNVIISAQVDYEKDIKDDFSQYDLYYPNLEQSDDNRNRYKPYQNHGYSYQVNGSYYMHLLRRWNIGVTSSYLQQYTNTESFLYRFDKIGYNEELGMLPSQEDYMRTVDFENSYNSRNMSRIIDNNFYVNHIYKKDKTFLDATISASIVYKEESIEHLRLNQRADMCTHNFYVEPKFNLECEFDGLKIKKYLFEYNNSVMTPNLIQMLYIRDTSNPLSIKQGNPNLQVSRVHHLEIHMDNEQWKKYFELKLTLNVLENMVANGFSYNPLSGVYTFCPQNVKGNWNSSASSYYRTYFNKQLNIQLEGRTNFNYVHNVDLAQVEGYNSSQLSSVNHYVTSQNLKASYNKENMRFEIGGTFEWNVCRREHNVSNNINAFDFSYGLSGQYTSPWNIQFATDLKMYSHRGYNEISMNTNELIWRVSISKPFLKGQLLARIDAYDILNQRSSTHYYINGQGRTEIWQLCMPRYAMFRLVYKFIKKPKNKK